MDGYGINEIANREIEKHVVESKNRIQSYWTKRSHEFSQLKMAEINSYMADLWLDEIYKYIPQNRKLKILDVGTGSGFFSYLLSDIGHEVIGIDLTESMIQEARNLRCSAKFIVMDAEKLLFKDNCFDVVISRNLTWTLPNPDNAYSEWRRVLKQGGTLLNFDAHYGHVNDADSGQLPENHAHKTLPNELLKECDNIIDGLNISYKQRPQWDRDYLNKIGFKNIVCDKTVSDRIYKKIDEFYNPTPLFAISAIK